MTPRDDAELLRRYLSGDVAAFETLVRAHENRVFGICLRMLREREAALDATQETFLTLFRKADRYEERAAFSTWLYRVTMNVCYDHLRRRRRRRAEALPDGYDPPDPTAGDPFTAVELRPAVEAALAELEPEYRAAVVLVDLEGLSLQRAADILGVPLGTVKSRIFRGRRRLADLLGNLAPGPDRPNGAP